MIAACGNGNPTPGRLALKGFYQSAHMRSDLDLVKLEAVDLIWDDVNGRQMITNHAGTRRVGVSHELREQSCSLFDER